MRLPRPVVHVVIVLAMLAGVLAGTSLYAYFGG
jgi:hypothetical protein